MQTELTAMRGTETQRHVVIHSDFIAGIYVLMCLYVHTLTSSGQHAMYYFLSFATLSNADIKYIRKIDVDMPQSNSE